MLNNKTKKIYNTFGTVSKSNRIIVVRSKMDTTNTQIHDHSLSRLGAGNSIKRDLFKLVLWAQT